MCNCCNLRACNGIKKLKYIYKYNFYKNLNNYYLNAVRVIYYDININKFIYMYFNRINCCCCNVPGCIATNSSPKFELAHFFIRNTTKLAVPLIYVAI